MDTCRKVVSPAQASHGRKLPETQQFLVLFAHCTKKKTKTVKASKLQAMSRSPAYQTAQMRMLSG